MMMRTVIVLNTTIHSLSKIQSHSFSAIYHTCWPQYSLQFTPFIPVIIGWQRPHCRRQDDDDDNNNNNTIYRHRNTSIKSLQGHRTAHDTLIYVGYHVDGAYCCLIGIVVVVTMKKYPPVTILSNNCEYCPVPNNPISVSFYKPTNYASCKQVHQQWVSEQFLNGTSAHRHFATFFISALEILLLTYLDT